MSSKRLITSLLALAAGLGLAACGSSRAPGVTLAPGGGATAASATASTSTSTTSSTTSTTPTNIKPPPQLSTEPVIHPPSGAPPKNLVVKDLIKGTGKAATPGSTITVNYVGALYKNGKVFDASWKRHQTFSTTLSNGRVISGWVKGIVGMKVGGRRELIIPPNLGYGKAGSPPSIPPNSTLIFDVDLLAVS